METNSSAINILHQLKELLFQLTEEEFCLPLDVFSGSSVGQHSRHILEFYFCLLEQASSKEVSYDKRRRDLKLEGDKYYNFDKISSLTDELEVLSSDYALDLVTELGGTTHQTPSSFSRELLYVIEHAVHHMAIIKIGVTLNFPNVTIDKHFGVAESTIRYIQSQ